MALGATYFTVRRSLMLTVAAYGKTAHTVREGMGAVYSLNFLICSGDEERFPVQRPVACREIHPTKKVFDRYLLFRLQPRDEQFCDNDRLTCRKNTSDTRRAVSLQHERRFPPQTELGQLRHRIRERRFVAFSVEQESPVLDSCRPEASVPYCEREGDTVVCPVAVRMPFQVWQHGESVV